MKKIVTLTAAAALALAVGFGGTAQAQITLPFDDDLIVYYSFDDQMDPTNDDSGNSLDGDLDGPTFETAAADKAPLSPNAAALDFDGTDDFVDVPNGATVKGLSQVTVSVWFNVDTLPGRFQYIYHESTPGANNSARLLLRIDNTDNMLHFGGRTNEANAFTVWVDSTTALSTGTWTHVAAVFNADTDVHKLYIDGVVQTNSVAESPFLNVDPADIKIANYGGAVNVEFDGLLDDVRVYNRELSAREIGQLASGIVITKELVSVKNIGVPADTTLGLNENWQFIQKVTVTNYSSTAFDLEDVVIIDGLPGDLELGDDTSQLKRDFDGSECPDDKLDETLGTATAFATGNSAKCHVTWTFDSLDEIAPGDSIMLTMDTSTDVNPRGLKKTPKPGQSFQEYTSDGPYCINQGATIFDDGVFVTQSNGLQVDNGTIVTETSATINNAGFEDASPADGDADAPGVPQWLGNIGTGTLNPSSATHFTSQAPEGDNVAFVAANLAAGGFLAQILSETLTAGKTYTLELEVGDAKDPVAFPGYEVALVAGLSFPPNIIASADKTDVDPGNDNFDPVTVEFFASAIDPNLGETLSILLLSDGIATFFDDVSLTITMPVVDMVEPEDCGS